MTFAKKTIAAAPYYRQFARKTALTTGRRQEIRLRLSGAEQFFVVLRFETLSQQTTIFENALSFT